MESDNRGVAVGLTLVLAVVLSLMPLSGDWIVWKPNFLLLVVMAWVIHWPMIWEYFLPPRWACSRIFYCA